MAILEGYEGRVRKVKAKSGKIYVYPYLVEKRSRVEHGGHLFTSKNGRLYYNYYKKKGIIDHWRIAKDQILERANGCCEVCGLPCHRLHIHHKDGNGRRSGIPNHSEDNLLAVCSKCHRLEHLRDNPCRLTQRGDKAIKLIDYHAEYPEVRQAALARIFGISRERVGQILGRVNRNSLLGT